MKCNTLLPNKDSLKKNSLSYNGNYTSSAASTILPNTSVPCHRLTFAEVKPLARGQWVEILLAHGFPIESLRNRHSPCPICQGTDRHRFDDKGGDGSSIYNQCGAHDPFTLISLFTGCSLKDALYSVGGYLGLTTSQPATPRPPRITQTPILATSEPDQRKIDTLKREYAASRPIQANDPVDQYLRNRRIKLAAYSKVLRCTDALPYYEDGKLISTHPAMLAVVQSPDGKPVTLHRTYLTTDGHKAAVTSLRKLMPPGIPSSILGAAIRLYPAKDTLYIAEGIETALAVHVATGFPVWATISANGMAALILPDTVKRVWIMADHDVNHTGEKAASILASRLRLKGCDCRVLLPKGPIPEHSKGIDFLDELGGAA